LSSFTPAFRVPSARSLRVSYTDLLTDQSAGAIDSMSLAARRRVNRTD
jgi:hypothetical protein